MSYLLTSMEEVRKENEKRQKILELKEAIKKAESWVEYFRCRKIKKRIKRFDKWKFLN